MRNMHPSEFFPQTYICHNCGSEIDAATDIPKPPAADDPASTWANGFAAGYDKGCKEAANGAFISGHKKGQEDAAAAMGLPGWEMGRKEADEEAEDAFEAGWEMGRKEASKEDAFDAHSKILVPRLGILERERAYGRFKTEKENLT